MTVPRRFRKIAIRAAFGFAFVYLAQLGGHWMEELGMLDGLRLMNLDTLVLSENSSVSDDIRLVLINDDDYRDIFARACPLPRAKVVELMEAVSSLGARRIAVDIATDSWTGPPPGFRESSAFVIWGRGFVESHTQPGAVESLDDFLGSPDPKACYGLTALQRERDLIVRSYHRMVADAGGKQAYPSLPYAVVSTDRQGDCPPPMELNHAALEGHQTIRFYGPGHNIPRISAKAVLRDKGRPDSNTGKLLSGKIVFIGGSYRQARDRYPTPRGSLYGAEILAHATQTELHGGIRSISEPALRRIELLLGIALVLVGCVLADWVSLVLAMVAIPVVSLSLSWLLFSSFGYFFNFVPVLCGVFLHTFFEHIKEHLQLVRSHARKH